MDDIRPCPFCGKKNIGVKEHLIERRAGHDCPCSAIKIVWSYCRYCEAEGPKRTVDAVYDNDVIAAATEAWNRRKE